MFRTITVALALCSALAAQRMGSVNYDAPTLTQTLSSADGFELVVEYTAIRWADGKMMERLHDPDAQRTRAYVNRSANSNPLGLLRSNRDLLLAGTSVRPGLYSLYFTIGEDDAKWRLHAQNEVDDDDHHEWALDLTDAETPAARLRLGLVPGDSTNTATIEIGFGELRATLGVAEDTSKILAAKQRISLISDAVTLFQVNEHRLPAMEELSEKPGTDPWGNPYRLVDLGDGKFDVVSSGPDGAEDTGDDIRRRDSR